jgi:hypothetical protein
MACLLQQKKAAEVIMTKNELLKKIAKLETVNDQLAAEINYLEKLSRALGFEEGLKTLKEAALEMLEADGSYED